MIFVFFVTEHAVFSLVLEDAHAYTTSLHILLNSLLLLLGRYLVRRHMLITHHLLLDVRSSTSICELHLSHHYSAVKTVVPLHIGVSYHLSLIHI